MPVLVVPPQELAGFVPDFDVVLADLSTLTEEEPLLAPLYDPRKKSSMTVVPGIGLPIMVPGWRTQDGTASAREADHFPGGQACCRWWSPVSVSGSRISRRARPLWSAAK